MWSSWQPHTPETFLLFAGSMSPSPHPSGPGFVLRRDWMLWLYNSLVSQVSLQLMHCCCQQSEWLHFGSVCTQKPTHPHTDAYPHTPAYIHAQEHKNTRPHWNKNTCKHAHIQTHTQTHKHVFRDTHRDAHLLFIQYTLVYLCDAEHACIHACIHVHTCQNRQKPKTCFSMPTYWNTNSCAHTYLNANKRIDMSPSGNVPRFTDDKGYSDGSTHFNYRRFSHGRDQLLSRMH